MPKPLVKEKIIGSSSARKTFHVNEFKDILTKVSDAAVGVIVVRTREPYRCQDVLHSWALEQGMEFRSWNVLKGWQTFHTPNSSTLDEEGVVHVTNLFEAAKSDGKINLLEAISLMYNDETMDVRSPDGCVYMYMNPPKAVWDAPAFHQWVKYQVQKAAGGELEEKRRRMILVVPETFTIPGEVENDIYIVDFKTPSHAELKEVYNRTIAAAEDGCLGYFKKADVEMIIQNAIGMAALEFEQSLAMAMVHFKERLFENHDTPVTPEEMLEEVMKSKIEVIKRTDLLELMASAKPEEVGGLDTLKTWLNVRRAALSDEAREFGVDQPKGIMVAGPPGTGKSLIAKAASNVLGVPCFRFDIGRVFSRYVGDSEGKMRAALRLVESMSPCVMLVDEVDKALGGVGSGGAGDSGVSQRVFGTLLTWLQENKAPVFTIMTANNVTGLPPELTRRGRLDEIFAVTFPTVQERIEILRIHVEKRGHTLSDEEYDEIARATDKFVGAELESIVKDAITECFYAGKVTLTARHVIDQAEAITPLSISYKDKVEAMDTWIKNNARMASSIAADPKKKRDLASGGGGLRKVNLKRPSTDS